jgi:hypothetical protein
VVGAVLVERGPRFRLAPGGRIAEIAGAMLPFPNRALLGWLALGLSAAFLVAGWWPFEPSPANRVSWLGSRPGLSFRGPGIAFDREPLPAAPGGAPTSFTIELFLEAELNAKTAFHGILSLHEPEGPARLSVCQWRKDLLVRVPDPGQARGFREASAPVLEARPRMVTITCGPGGTAFYADGRPLVRYPKFWVPASALEGCVLLGDVPEGKAEWQGRLFGLALIGRALEPAEVGARQAAWADRNASALADQAGLRALYLFDEGRGPRAQDRSPARHALELPEDYAVPHKIVFEWHRDPWTMLHPAYLEDSVLNLLGFLPFGLLVCLYVRGGGAGWVASWLFAVLAGALLSALIEGVQIWLPARVSSATDLVLNSVGSALGATMAWGASGLWRRWLR